MEITWRNEKRKIKDLVPYVANPRQITDQQAKNLKASLERFGVVDPIIVNTDNLIIGGHQRKKILETLINADPDYLVDVRVPDREMTIDEVRELNVRLNKNVAEWDFDVLANNFDVDELLSWGFDKTDLDFDLWDDPEQTKGEARKSLFERFVVPPFSVLDARQGYWQKRKKAWIDLGIKGELGRDKVQNSMQSVWEIMKDRPGEEAETWATTSIFDPVLCELAYRWFCPKSSRILDPFAGGSVRGIVASILGHKYTGVDISRRQIEANEQQAEELLDEGKPNWIVGDSTDIKKLASGNYDFIFSCPPYYDLEVYSDTQGDLSAMDTYESFLSNYRQIIADSVSMLDKNRFACFVVGDVRDKKGFYRNFPADTITAFQDAGMKLYNEAILVTMVASMPLRVNGQFQGYRKLGKTHQNVLVFYDGDPKAIKGFGEVEVGDIPETAELFCT